MGGLELEDRCTSWRFAFACREKVTARLRRGIRDLQLPGLQLMGVYGPVEASISCSRDSLDCHDPCQDTSDIVGESFSGPPMPNYSIVIADQDLRPVPIGHPGEIYIAGPGLAKGYLNSPEEDAQTFTNDPYASADDIQQGFSALATRVDFSKMVLCTSLDD